jgi:hypothetical protein
VVSPQAKREAVGILTAERALGVTRACGLVGISRSLYCYRSRGHRRWSSEAALPSSLRRSAATAIGASRCCFVGRAGR